MEIWKSTHIRNDYEVSNMGRVRRIKRDPKRYGKYTYINGQKQRYVLVRLAGKTVTLHRLVAIAHLPNPQNKPYVCHRDNNTYNNCVDNLYWGNASENTKQAHNDGLIKVVTPFVKLVECPYCKKALNYGNAKRWHFENCKYKK